MNAKRVALWCLTILVLFTGSLKADNLVFAVSSFNEFGTVDLNTGAFTLTGYTTVGSTPCGVLGLSRVGRHVIRRRFQHQPVYCKHHNGRSYGCRICFGYVGHVR